MEQKKGNNKSKGKYILLGIGAIALISGAAYYITQSARNKQSSLLDDDLVETATIPTTLPARTERSTSGFPLKKGSRGDLVKNIQETLISKYGTGILPKYGADGVWGSEMQTALIAKGLPTTISADDFKTIITSGSKASADYSATKPKKKKFNPALLAKNLRIAIMDDDLNQVLRSLSKIWTVKGYTMVNTEFQKKKVQLHDNSSKVTSKLVTALLTRFSGSSEKKKLNAHFSRMGLKFDGRKWSLSGLLGNDELKTIRDTLVWNDAGQKMNVPAHTIIGEFVDAHEGITQFRTLDHQLLYIATESISYK